MATMTEVWNDKGQETENDPRPKRKGDIAERLLDVVEAVQQLLQSSYGKR